MSTPLLPIVALAALSSKAPSAELVARASGPLHLHNGARPGLADFTRSGALRAGRRPVCRNRARRWYLAEVDGRPLCRSCATWARRHLPLTAAPVTAAQLADTLARATTAAEVDAVQSAALAAGVVAQLVPQPDPKQRPMPLHTLIRHARSRLTPARPGVVERNWLERAQASRFPRRIA